MTERAPKSAVPRSAYERLLGRVSSDGVQKVDEDSSLSTKERSVLDMLQSFQRDWRESLDQPQQPLSKYKVRKGMRRSPCGEKG